MWPFSTRVLQPPVLPMTRDEMRALGWETLDVLLVTGDAYVDHPAFGAALLGRFLVALGYRVGIVAQPGWQNPRDIESMGRPRLFAGVTSGALDSMLAHYTAFRKKRNDDAYTPGGRAGSRPNRAVIVYSNLVRQAFPGLPVVIGGIEASMRRVSHYDFWTDAIRKSILLDSKADLLVYGMAERALLETARRLDTQPTDAAALSAEVLRGIPGTAFVTNSSHAGIPTAQSIEALPSHDDIVHDPRSLMRATLRIEQQVHGRTPWLTQVCENRVVAVSPPGEPLAADELDALYDLPFSRRAHPAYREAIPALKTIQFTLTTHRGCAGGCTFCALAGHQGRRIQSRSASSIIREATLFSRHAEWRGTIDNVGGPSANMWATECRRTGPCARPSCLWPAPCQHLHPGQMALVSLLRRVAALPGVRFVRSASGIRYDLAGLEPGYMPAVARDFVGGHLTVAPEHMAAHVLHAMRKPAFETFERFCDEFESLSKQAGKEQFLVPYLLTAFPGSTDEDTRRLADWFSRRHWKPQQVQCFIPTPGTVATAMFWSGTDAEGHRIPVARTDAERMRQHYLLIGKPAHSPRSGSRRQVTRHTRPFR